MKKILALKRSFRMRPLKMTCLLSAAIFACIVVSAAERPYSTSRPKKTAFSEGKGTMEVETNVSSSSARKQWRKGEVTDATARQLAAKQKKEFKPAPAPSPVEAYPMPSYDKTKTPPRDDQWRKENSDRRWQAWRRFPAEKQILLWRDLERSEREDYWKKMNVHERSTLWSHMTDEEKEMGWSTISENERQELCGNLMPGERSRWSSRLAKVSAAGETPAHQDKFKPAQPAPGYTPKSNFTEVE